jgi:MFS family permease
VEAAWNFCLETMQLSGLPNTGTTQNFIYLFAMKTIKEQHKSIATIVAYAIAPLSGIAVDLYSPSLPAMARDLNVSVLQIQFSVSIYLIAYGLSQLFVGTLLDSFGRFKLSQIALLIFSITCFGIAIFPNIQLIYFFRIIQGISIGFVLVSKRAYLVDVFEGEKLKHALSLFTVIWAIGPIIAPFIGGNIQNYLGWEYNFYFLGLTSLLGVILDFIYGGETLRSPNKFNFNHILGSYTKMLGSADFLLGIVLCSLSYSIILIFTLTSPFLIEHTMHFSSLTTGYALLVIGVSMLTGNLLGKLLIRYNFMKTGFIANVIQLAIILSMFFVFRFWPNLYTLVGLTSIVTMMSAFVFNNYFTYCLRKFPEAAGIAGGLTGGLMYIFVSGITYLLVRFIPVTVLTNLATYDLILAGSISIALISFVRMQNKRVLVGKTA